MHRLLPFLLSLGVAQAAFAQDAASPSVRERIDQALELEASLEYEQAAELLLQVIADERATDAELMEANLRAGILQRIIDNDVEARLHFIYVLKRDADAQLPDGMPPKISAFFELVRRELAEDAKPDIKPPPPAPAPVDEGNPTLFWSGAATTAVGGILLVGAGGAAALGELTYADTSASRAARQQAQDFAPLAWGGVGVGAGLALVGAILMATGL